jgi:hypothetical protein
MPKPLGDALFSVTVVYGLVMSVQCVPQHSNSQFG